MTAGPVVPVGVLNTTSMPRLPPAAMVPKVHTALPFVNPVQLPELGVIETGVAPDGSVTVTATPPMLPSLVLRIVKRVLASEPAVTVLGVTDGVTVRPTPGTENAAVTVASAVNVT